MLRRNSVSELLASRLCKVIMGSVIVVLPGQGVTYRISTLPGDHDGHPLPARRRLRLGGAAAARQGGRSYTTRWNTTLGLSTHAEQRMQQRGFRKQDIDLVRVWGTPVDDGILLLQKDVAEAMRRKEPEIDRLRHLRDTMLVIRNGVVLTCFRETEKRIRRTLRRPRRGPLRARRGRSRGRPSARRSLGRVFASQALA